MNIQTNEAPDAYPERLEHAKHGFQLRQRLLHHDEALFQVIEATVLEFIRRDPAITHRDSPSYMRQFQNQCPGRWRKPRLQTAKGHQQESKERQLC